MPDRSFRFPSRLDAKPFNFESLHLFFVSALFVRIEKLEKGAKPSKHDERKA